MNEVKQWLRKIKVSNDDGLFNLILVQHLPGRPRSQATGHSSK